MNVAIRNGNGLPSLSWYDDPKMVALVKRTAAKDCDRDEFDEFIAVARELKLNPLRKQIYAFVFSKDDAKKRNMVIVVGIDGMRAISARGGLYRPDNRAPRWTINESAANPDVNPLGLVCCEVSIFIGHKLRDAVEAERIEWNEVVGVAYWDEFAPILKTGDEDDYQWVETGEVWEDTGKPKKKKKLRAGAEVKLRLDPKKDGWRKSGRHMLAKCAEAIAHRKANPEPLSRVYSDEELDRARAIEVDYTDLTPSEMAERGETDKRLELIGGPALLASLNDTGVLERVPTGQFADRVMAAIDGKSPDWVASFTTRNRVALQEFWAHNKTDALTLKKMLEERAAGAKPSPNAAPRSSQGETADRPAPSASSLPAQGGAGAADPIDQVGRGKAVADNRAGLKAAIAGEIEKLTLMTDCFTFAQTFEKRMETLPLKDKADLRAAFSKQQETVRESLNRD